MRHIPLIYSALADSSVTINPPAGDIDFEGFVPEIEVTRQLVWEDDFSPGWYSRLPWIFHEDNDEPPIVLTDHPNFNGFGGLDVMYPAGSGTNIRWGGQLFLPAGYPEGWFSFDIMLQSPYSVKVGQKSIGVYSDISNISWPITPDCNDGWIARCQLERSNNSAGDNVNNAKGGQLYTYTNSHGGANSDGWPRVAGEGVIELDTVSRIELYWKINSDISSFDGAIQHRYDPGTALVHAPPVTVRQELTNVRMYCNSEANRAGSFISEISVSTFFGGNTTGWEPTVDTTFTIGRMAVEIPA